MKAITQGNGSYWQTDDAAGLWFNEVDHGDPPPEELKCINLQNSPRRATIRIEDMQLLAVGRFTNERVARVKYTGQYQKFGIYEARRGRVREIVIVSHNGAGMNIYLLSALWSVETWRNLALELSTDMLWSLCHEVIDAYKAGIEAERKKLYVAFLDGKLKKRKRNGCVRIEVLP